MYTITDVYMHAHAYIHKLHFFLKKDVLLWYIAMIFYAITQQIQKCLTAPQHVCLLLENVAWSYIITKLNDRLLGSLVFCASFIYYVRYLGQFFTNILYCGKKIEVWTQLDIIRSTIPLPSSSWTHVFSTT